MSFPAQLASQCLSTSHSLLGTLIRSNPTHLHVYPRLSPPEASLIVQLPRWIVVVVVAAAVAPGSAAAAAGGGAAGAHAAVRK